MQGHHFEILVLRSFCHSAFASAAGILVTGIFDHPQLGCKKAITGSSAVPHQRRRATAVFTGTADCPQLWWQTALARHSRWPSWSQRAFALYYDTWAPACSESPEAHSSSGSALMTHPEHQSRPAAARQCISTCITVGNSWVLDSICMT